MRIDRAQKHDFIEAEGFGFSDLPLTMIYFEGEFFLSKEASEANYDQFLNHLARIVNPLPVLKSDEDVTDFLNLEK